MGARGYTQTSQLSHPPKLAVPAGQTRYVVSKVIGVSASSSLNFSLFIDVEDVIVGVGETIKCYLQQFDGESWGDVGAPQALVTVDAGDGTYCIFLSIGVEAEALVLPLTSQVRVAIETGATSTCSVTRITTFDRT